jgi:transcriptional regulator with XRE-family HTH domain
MGIDVCVRVGRRISSLRIAKGMPQVVLAELSGIERSNLSKIENGRQEPGLRTLYRIALALNVSMAQLLEGVN